MNVESITHFGKGNLQPPTELKCGIEVIKEGGDYEFQGIIVATFNKLCGGPARVVVENKDGILHIFNPTQLKKV